MSVLDHMALAILVGAVLVLLPLLRSQVGWTPIKPRHKEEVAPWVEDG